MNNQDYPVCSNCKTITEADWFLDEEYKYIEGSVCRTGRVRMMVELKPCALCGKEMHLNEIHLCGDIDTLIHTCINDIKINIQADTKYDVARKWNALMAVIMK